MGATINTRKSKQWKLHKQQQETLNTTSKTQAMKTTLKTQKTMNATIKHSKNTEN